MLERSFPVMADNGPILVGHVPFWVVKAHEAQAMKNHGGQSVDRLASRGGLAPSELAAVLEDRPYRDMTDLEAVAAVHGAILRAMAYD